MNYLFLSSVTLALMFIGYKISMSHTTFYRFNRIVLLTIFVLSAILPFAQFDRLGRKVTNLIPEIELSRKVTNYTSEIEKPVEANAVYPLTNTSEPIEIDYTDSFVPTQRETIQTEEKPAKTLSPIEILRLFYVIGLILFLSNLIISIIRTEIICHKRGRYLSDGTKLVLLPNEFSPFSWRRCIVMSETDYKRDGMTIETHELAHVHNHHTFDLVLAQICCTTQWFNPTAWALLYCLKEQHEFEADSTVLQHGIEAKEYQICLIRTTLVHKLVLAANNFADCSTKKRINMMNKKSTLPLARFRVLIMLPIILVIIAVASGCKSKNSNNQLSATGQEETVFETVEEPIITDTLAYLFNYSNQYKDFLSQDYYKKNMDKIFMVRINRHDEIFARTEVTNITNLKSLIKETYPDGTDSITAILSFDISSSKKFVMDVFNILRSEFEKGKNKTRPNASQSPSLIPGLIIPAPKVYTEVNGKLVLDTLAFLFHNNQGPEKMKESEIINNRDKYFDVRAQEGDKILANGENISITDLRSKIHEWYPNGTDSVFAIMLCEGASKKVLVDIRNILDSEFKNDNIYTMQRMRIPDIVSAGVITDTLKHLHWRGIKYCKAEKYLTDGRHTLFDVSINSNNEISENDQVIEITELKSKIQETFPKGTARGLALLSYDPSASKKLVMDVFDILDAEFVSFFTNDDNCSYCRR